MNVSHLIPEWKEEKKKKGALQNVSPRCHCELPLSSVDESHHGHPREQTEIRRLFEMTRMNNEERVEMLEKCPDAFNHHGM